jgi:transcriptional regulator with XRE-family HTH domain
MRCRHYQRMEDENMRRPPLNPATARSLADRRRAAGLTQNDLALRLGVSESVVSRWETLRAPIRPEALARVEQILAGAQKAALMR